MISRDDRRTPPDDGSDRLHDFMVLVQTMRLEQVRFYRFMRSGTPDDCVKALRNAFVLQHQVDQTISNYLDRSSEGDA